MHRVVHWLDYGDLVSKEAEVLGLTKHFASGGDEGAMVTNQEADLVGLLIGTDSSSNDFAIGFVTPIADI